MEEHPPPEIEPAREEQVRALGFDPGHLTPEEQVELLEIHTTFGFEAMALGEWAVG